MLKATSLRVLFALSSSVVVTAAIAGPMGFQAHQARSAVPTTQVIDPAVLGTTQLPSPRSSTTTSSVPDTTVAPDESPTTTATTTTTTTPTTPTPTTRPRSSVPAPRSATTSPPRVVVRPPNRPAPTTTAPPDVPATTAPGSSTTSTTTTTRPPVLAANLFWSRSGPERAEGLLDGANVEGSVFVFAEADDVARVEFQLDSEVVSIENLWPWELLGGRPLDTAQLEPGEHIVLATIDFLDGTRAIQRATFTVAG